MTTSLFTSLVTKPIGDGGAHKVALEIHGFAGQPLPHQHLVDAVSGVLAQLGVAEKLDKAGVAGDGRKTKRLKG